MSSHIFVDETKRSGYVLAAVTVPDPAAARKMIRALVLPGQRRIWALQSQITNYFLPQQKLVAKVRDGAKITKRYDRPTSPHHRAYRHEQVSPQDKAIMADSSKG